MEHVDSDLTSGKTGKPNRRRPPYELMGNPEIVDKRSVSEPNLMRPDLGRTALVSGIFVWGAMLPVIGFSIYELTSWGEPGWVVTGIWLFEFVLGHIVWRLIVVTNVSFGIVLGESGVTYYERSVNPKKVIKRFFRWEDLHDPAIDVTKVDLRAERFPMSLSYDQARELFSHERCPAKARPSVEMARKLGV